MKALVFLDVDGVLNGHERYEPAESCWIRQDCVDEFNRVLATVDPEIVISSSWRYMIHGGAMGLDGFEYMLRTHRLAVRRRIIGVTPSDEDVKESRGHQIRRWLNENGGDRRYVVLDDLDLGITEAKHPFVQTDGTRGMTAEDADRAIAILKGVADDDRCKHPPEAIVDGPRVPLVYGSSASVLCTVCGSHRLTFNGACRWEPGPPDTSEREVW